MYKCKLLDLLDKNILNSEQSVSKLHFMVKRDSEVSSPSWDFSENQILLDIKKSFYSNAPDVGKANKKSINFKIFL